jgi:hypothetical protein
MAARTNCINPRAYSDLAFDLTERMQRARALGLYRTAEKIHKALRECRAETPEAMPLSPVTVTFKIGPVREQHTMPPKGDKKL